VSTAKTCHFCGKSDGRVAEYTVEYVDCVGEYPGEYVDGAYQEWAHPRCLDLHSNGDGVGLPPPPKTISELLARSLAFCEQVFREAPDSKK
jgi:hypothetical protein